MSALRETSGASREKGMWAFARLDHGFGMHMLRAPVIAALAIDGFLWLGVGVSARAVASLIG